MILGLRMDLERILLGEEREAGSILCYFIIWRETVDLDRKRLATLW